ncbi:hypothetical protein NW761_010178 [Fusarium oxysporum]|nr:hypothetical protein NW753_013081 [Fusarium oxysporum]KAJ4040989.1 hypothetical protein NW758_007882 [Fusarium oxysporum]KAJ4064284.1 hypothetical protein NW763_004569 [Fusarium oxysporum]KAJ4078657.1 hypothetical protein NW756_011777 [Fusarium oxysporum]KAJ4082675.1 hypothetical protein NW761_010178 [Fusarium oxysporum]
MPPSWTFWHQACPKGAVERRHPQAADVSSRSFRSLLGARLSHPVRFAPLGGRNRDTLAAVSERLGRQRLILIGLNRHGAAPMSYPPPWPLASTLGLHNPRKELTRPHSSLSLVGFPAADLSLLPGQP